MQMRIRGVIFSQISRRDKRKERENEHIDGL